MSVFQPFQGESLSLGAFQNPAEVAGVVIGCRAVGTAVGGGYAYKGQGSIVNGVFLADCNLRLGQNGIEGFRGDFQLCGLAGVQGELHGSGIPRVQAIDGKDMCGSRGKDSGNIVCGIFSVNGKLYAGFLGGGKDNHSGQGRISIRIYHHERILEGIAVLCLGVEV